MIQTGLLITDSIFTSIVLMNSEVWLSVTKSQVDDLEITERMLMRNILNAHCKNGIEWIVADTGKHNLKSLIQIKRVMYLWHVLSRNESEMIHRV